MRIDSLAGIDSLADGPRPRGGDERTVDVAGGLLATEGPSWRFVMDWGSRQASAAYPGGQSENPASPWWADRVAGWWDGRYAPMLTLDAARRLPGSRTWTLAP